MNTASKCATLGFLVLAAGHSRRFGRCKLTTAYTPSGLLILEQTLAAIKAVGAPIKLVTSVSKQEVISIAKKAHIEIILLEDNSAGIGNSIAHGIQACGDWQGAFICLADMPFIDTRTYCYLFHNCCQAAHMITRPRCLGSHGHPVYFPQNFFSQLSALEGGSGAKQVIDQNRAYFRSISVDSPAVFRDIDTPDQLISKSI